MRRRIFAGATPLRLLETLFDMLYKIEIKTPRLGTRFLTLEITLVLINIRTSYRAQNSLLNGGAVRFLGQVLVPYILTLVD